MLRQSPHHGYKELDGKHVEHWDRESSGADNKSTVSGIQTDSTLAITAYLVKDRQDKLHVSQDQQSGKPNGRAVEVMSTKLHNHEAAKLSLQLELWATQKQTAQDHLIEGMLGLPTSLKSFPQIRHVYRKLETVLYRG